MVRGFTAGYNKYVRDTDPGDLPPECRNGPWVVEIEPADLVAHYRIVAQYASGDLFATGAVFIAVPPGVDPEPGARGVQVVDADGVGDDLRADTHAVCALGTPGSASDYVDTGLASNAWGVGSELSETGRGALLANPHFPYTGVRRFFESQITVPELHQHPRRRPARHADTADRFQREPRLVAHGEHQPALHRVPADRSRTGDPLTYIKAGVEKPITV
jgi:acyl-homoserine-lactone acylase